MAAGTSQSKILETINAVEGIQKQLAGLSTGAEDISGATAHRRPLSARAAQERTHNRQLTGVYQDHKNIC